MSKKELGNKYEGERLPDIGFENHMFRLRLSFMALSLASVISMGIVLRGKTNTSFKYETKVSNGYKNFCAPIGYELYRDENGNVYAKKSEKKEVKVPDGYEGHYAPSSCDLYRDEMGRIYPKEKTYEEEIIPNGYMNGWVPDGYERYRAKDGFIYTRKKESKDKEIIIGSDEYPSITSDNYNDKEELVLTKKYN